MQRRRCHGVGTDSEGVSRCPAEPEGFEHATWVAVTQLRIDGMAGGSCAAAARVLTQSRIWRSPVWPARIPTICLATESIYRGTQANPESKTCKHVRGAQVRTPARFRRFCASHLCTTEIQGADNACFRRHHHHKQTSNEETDDYSRTVRRS